MIKKSLWIFLTLLVTYQAIIMMMPSLAGALHLWQGNIIMAQEYIYNESSLTNNVIIGSSLSSRINIWDMPDYYNLSFPGLSIFNGLNTLKHKKTLPKNVFIETNSVLTKENEEFNKTMFSPIMFTLRKYIISMRDNKQPIPIMVSGLNSLKKRVEIAPNRSDSQKIESFNTLLKLNIDEYSKQPDEKLIDKQFLSLLEYVNYLKKHNVNVIFYEMPVNFNLTELPFLRIVRSNFYHYFPKEKFQYIEVPNGRKFITSDGIHLMSKEAIEYTSYFKAQANKITGIK